VKTLSVAETTPWLIYEHKNQTTQICENVERSRNVNVDDLLICMDKKKNTLLGWNYGR
jgi:hypothetical protein